MSHPPTRPEPAPRTAYQHFVPITTRWMDNDVYGHVNNVVYYSFFDTAVNQFLIEQGALDIEAGATIGLVVHSSCDYFQPLSFPGRVDAGLRVALVGSSSIQYEVGLFGDGHDLAAACGRFVHVYVDRETRRPQPLPQALRAAVARLQVETTNSSGEVQP
jgi:acyl-CoA thioester hydrolase